MGKKSASQKRRERNKFKREKRNRETDRAKTREEGGPGGSDERDREYARDLIATAWRTDVPEGREALAREALTVFPDCADALIVLAELPTTEPPAALALCEQALAAAIRRLEDDDIDELDVEDDPEAGPYLRARFALARLLLAADKRDQAMGHLQWLLQTDPTDRVGAQRLLDGMTQQD